MDRQRMQDYLGHVAAYQASGQKASQWAAEHGVPLRSLASWCAHAARWQARLDGVSLPAVAKPVGFVAARLRGPFDFGAKSDGSDRQQGRGCPGVSR